ncbi:hypothetical protein J6590_032918 [Homalodisca vitripennis]|nr:hypothetical protein J6590_032918 [Homalodisca vitripennis]
MNRLHISKVEVTVQTYHAIYKQAHNYRCPLLPQRRQSRLHTGNGSPITVIASGISRQPRSEKM